MAPYKTKSVLKKFSVLWLVVYSKSPQKFLLLRENSESEQSTSQNFYNTMLKKDLVFSEYHVKQVLTLELSVSILVFYSESEVICKSSEEVEVETWVKTNT